MERRIKSSESTLPAIFPARATAHSSVPAREQNAYLENVRKQRQDLERQRLELEARNRAEAPHRRRSRTLPKKNMMCAQFTMGALRTLPPPTCQHVTIPHMASFIILITVTMNN